MVDWDRATFEAVQEDAVPRAAILSDEVRAEISLLRSENEVLKESMADVRALLDYEDRGWQLISQIASGEHLEGLDLNEVKEISQRIRPRMTAISLAKRGADLHAGYVWSKGVHIEGTESTGGPGRPAGLSAFFRNTTNQESIFSAIAHEELQKARYADGNVFALCDTQSKTVRLIPLKDITAVIVNPDFPTEVIAYRREWKPDPEKNPKVRWYYTNRWDGKKQKSFTSNGVTEIVDLNSIIVDKKFNRAPGYVLGIPDAIAAMPHIAAYDEIMAYGRVVTESLAKILYKVTSASKSGVQSTGVKIAGFGGHGGTASMMEGQDLSAVSTAGRGYDFSSARPVAAMAAAALNVSNMDLLNDSAAAGSSYGSAAALVPANKNAMRLMQAEWVELYEEILSVFKLTSKRVWFDPIDDADLYRESQSLKLLSDALSDEEYRRSVLDLLDVSGDPLNIPDTLKLRSQAPETGAAAQQAAPDQGRATGSGNGSQNDMRNDTISQSLLPNMQMDALVERLESILARFDEKGL